MQLQYSPLPLLLLALLGAFPAQGAEESNTGLFTVYVRNSSFPDIDGKKMIIHYSGLAYVSAGVADPRLSYPIVASVKDNSLVRDRTNQPLSSPGTIGNLNFGTSSVCCNYAALNFSSPDAIPYPARTKPFYVTRGHYHGSGGGELVFNEPGVYRQKWYACDKSAGKQIYYNIPFYEFPGTGGQKECTIVTLQTAKTSVTPVGTPTP